MPKTSLLTEDERDQLLKELAFGIPISELSAKYKLKPIQIEYQRGNNAALYNMYVDYFCIKPEIWDMEDSDLGRFILNILWGKVKPLGLAKYSYKGKIVSIYDLIDEVNKVLIRENLPTIKKGEPIRIRYTAKRSYNQQITKVDNSNCIKKFNFLNVVASNKDCLQFNLIDALINEKKKINWKTQLITKHDNLSEVCLWYRLFTEGKRKSKNSSLLEIPVILKFLYKHDLLENNYFNLVKNKDAFVLTLKENVNEDIKFSFKGFEIFKDIESFINEYCLDLNLETLDFCLELAYKTSKEELLNYKGNLKKDLLKFCNLFDNWPIEDYVIDNLTIEKVRESVEGLEND